MAAEVVTLMDLAKRCGPDGKVAGVIAEMLAQTNEILEDMSWLEGNLPTGHLTTVRTGLPDVAWRMLNYGVKPSKSKTKQVTDVCGMLEAYAQVDKKLADLNGNTQAFRVSEDRAFLESMNQEMAKTLIYGDTTADPKKFCGIAPRLSSLSAESGANVINAGGDADRTSIYLVVWGPNTVHGIVPKGSKAGIQHQDLGEVTLTDAEGGQYQGYRSHYSWDCGLTVKDWRYIARIANIKTSALTKNAATGADLIDLLTQLVELPPTLSLGRPVIYCNKTIKSFLRRQIVNKSNVHLSLDQVAGKKVLTFDDIPVKRIDQITNAEAAVA
jgi:hypothetical protein